jgi:hypothetical protein
VFVSVKDIKIESLLSNLLFILTEIEMRFEVFEDRGEGSRSEKFCCGAKLSKQQHL